jgi:(1->4)-alpha-D-glucan 1-alpha-D-glucosylmutase
VGVRVEDERVFAETHALLVALHFEGGLDGLRIDHPDGLAAPGAYLQRLAESTGGAWVVVEKILEGAEALPDDWRCAGTTGYDALLQVGGLLRDPAGEEPLTTLYTELTGEPESFEAVVEEGKRYVVEHALYTEVHRLAEVAAAICESDIHLRDHTRRALHEALVEMLVAFPVYRAYVVPGETVPQRSIDVLEECAAIARDRLPQERHETVDLVRDLALGRHGRDTRRDEFVVRFQQTCGPVMAKGVEDTAFYRWFRFAGANEVGGDPARIGVSPQEFHEWCAEQQRTWPVSMTTLSTHDTKRAEDVRARLAVLTELPEVWAGTVTAWLARAGHLRSEQGFPERNTEYLLWQTLIGAWPLDSERLTAYLEKATREAKRHTTWTTPDHDYDAAVRAYAERVLADRTFTTEVTEFVERLAPAFRSNVLAQKLVQLTMPGVPDVYQGSEFVELSLVDPDNRRAVDYAARRALLDKLDSGARPRDLDAEKLLVTTQAMRLRRERPEWFGPEATYAPVPTSSQHALAFARSGAVVTVATRLPVGLGRRGGWQADDSVDLASGRWVDRLTGRSHDGGAVSLREVLAELPVALLVRS